MGKERVGLLLLFVLGVHAKFFYDDFFDRSGLSLNGVARTTPEGCLLLTDGNRKGVVDVQPPPNGASSSSTAAASSATAAGHAAAPKSPPANPLSLLNLEAQRSTVFYVHRISIVPGPQANFFTSFNFRIIPGTGLQFGDCRWISCESTPLHKPSPHAGGKRRPDNGGSSSDAGGGTARGWDRDRESTKELAARGEGLAFVVSNSDSSQAIGEGG